MNLFYLTETEFFRQLTEGHDDRLHIAYRDFVLMVSEMYHTHNHRGNVISALLYAEVEIAHIQTEKLRNTVNQELAAVVNKTLQFVRKTLAMCKDMKSTIIPDENPIPECSLNWTAKKPNLLS